MHPNSAFFDRDPTGGQIDYWLYDGRTTASPPIVLVGSEGELNILSDTLKQLLERLAKGNTQDPDFESRDENGNEPSELAKWLESRAENSPICGHRTHPNLKKWMEQSGSGNGNG